MQLSRNSNAWRWLLLAAGGSVFVLSGCDPNVRDVVLGGVEQSSSALMQTLIQAFFQSLSDPNAATTVMNTLEQSLPIVC